MNNVNIEIKKTYDLEERCVKLAETIIELLKKIRVTIINKSIIEQLIRSSTSIGANYCEANEAESKKDFIHKVKITKKEIKETEHWLRLLTKTDINLREEIIPLWQETHELLLIFSKIISTSKLNK